MDTFTDADVDALRDEPAVTHASADETAPPTTSRTPLTTDDDALIRDAVDHERRQLADDIHLMAEIGAISVRSDGTLAARMAPESCTKFPLRTGSGDPVCFSDLRPAIKIAERPCEMVS